MHNANIIRVVRGIHAVVFAFLSACLVIVLVSGIAGVHSALTWVATAAIAVEGAALALNAGRCPLSLLAERCGDCSGPIVRAFFPEWLVPWVTPSFCVLATVGVALVLLR